MGEFMSEKWWALHIFIHEKNMQDDFLLYIYEVIYDKMNSGNIAKWFFIRYWEGGPHIRLRIKGNREVFEEIEEEVYNWIKQNRFSNLLNKETFYAASQFDGYPVNTEQLPWYNNGSVEEFLYEPEIDRYGGENVIPYCETIFQISSYFTLMSMNKSRNISTDISIISGIAFLLKCIEIIEGDFKEFISEGIYYWKKFEDNVERKFSNEFYLAQKIILPTNLADDLTQLLLIIKTRVSNHSYLKSIIISIIHMNFNRLGVTPPVEYTVYQYLKETYSGEKI